MATVFDDALNQVLVAPPVGAHTSREIDWRNVFHARVEHIVESTLLTASAKSMGVKLSGYFDPGEKCFAAKRKEPARRTRLGGRSRQQN